MQIYIFFQLVFSFEFEFDTPVYIIDRTHHTNKHEIPNDFGFNDLCIDDLIATGARSVENQRLEDATCLWCSQQTPRPVMK